MKVNKQNCGGYLCVPAVVLEQLCDDVEALGGMLGELVCLYEKESLLKKHHRAYLHVREYADKACIRYKERMKEISNHWIDQKITCEDMGCKNPTNDPYVEEVLNEKSEKEEIAEYQEEDVVEFSKLPKGMVLMTSDSLGVMHDDMICLTEGLDVMVALFKAVLAGCPMKREDVESVLNMTSAMSEEVFKRWEEAEMIQLD